MKNLANSTYTGSVFKNENRQKESQRATRADWGIVVYVLASYLTAQSRTDFPISAVSFDRYARKPLNPFVAAVYKVDVENALYDSLGNDDNAVEWQCVVQMVKELQDQGESTRKRFSLELRSKVVRQLAVTFYRRGLQRYFVQQGHK